MQISHNRRLARRLLYAAFSSSLFSYVGIILENTGVKVVSAVLQFVVLFLAIDVLKRYRHYINWRMAGTLLLVIAIYPLVRILIDVGQDFAFKTFTDGFIVQGSYYQLMIAGLAMAVLTSDGSGYEMLYKFAFLAIPIGCALTVVAIRSPEEIGIVIGHLAINNCFIPVALLALYPVKRKTIVVGWLAILLILILAAKLWSRSYTLVGFYFAALAILGFFNTGRRRYGYLSLVLIAVIYFSGVLSLFQQKSAIRDSSVAEKYQFSSLGKALEQFENDGNLVKLFFWEGNSRADIIVDAFGNFSTREFLFGKGIFGKYTSFIEGGTIERSTIEIGWAEELFRWGVPYVVFTLFLILYARRKLRKTQSWKQDPMVKLLAGLLLIKFLDGLVFGMPYNSVYNLILFWGISRITIINGNIPENIPNTHVESFKKYTAAPVYQAKIS